MDVLRWGRSAYETEADLRAERQGVEALGLTWGLHESRTPPPRLEGVGALVVNSGVRVDASVLQRFSGSLVLTTTSGWDHIDVEAAGALGIGVARLPLARRDAVAAQALGAALLLTRRFPALLASAQRGHWARGDLPALAPLSLDQARVAVIGVGIIGRRMIEVLAPFGCTVLGVDPRGVPPGVVQVSLPEALATADIISLHCALNPTSRGMIHRGNLPLIQPHAVLINTARGDLIDVEAAVQAVQAGQLGGLHLDVFPDEPCQKIANYAEIDGVWITPHAAGYVRDLGRRIADGVVHTLTAWRREDPLPWSVPLSAPGGPELG